MSSCEEVVLSSVSGIWKPNPSSMQGNYSDLLVQLSNIYSQLRGDTSGEKNEDSAQVKLLISVSSQLLYETLQSFIA